MGIMRKTKDLEDFILYEGTTGLYEGTFELYEGTFRLYHHTISCIVHTRFMINPENNCIVIQQMRMIWNVKDM